MGGKIISRIRLTSAKDLVEVEAELGNMTVTAKPSITKYWHARQQAVF